MGQLAPKDVIRRNVAARGFQLLSPSFLDELRARLTLSQIVGRSVPLKKAGNEWKACCPFHKEKTPSFWVNDQKGFYHCFGCGAHGDAIRFLTDAQGLSFMDAVKELAGQSNLALPEPDPAFRARAEQAIGLGDIVEQAATFFQQMFQGLEGVAARGYAKDRGLSQETIDAFRIGYAPGGRSRLRAGLPAIEPDELVEAGLLISVEGKELYDRFRNRLIVPIRSPRGRVIAFGGRALDGSEPKYLNSPETPLFDKGRTLFNLDRAAPACRRSGRLFVVEGYLDAIALDQVGIREVVAPLGTALTETQLELLWKQVDEPTLCFDGDVAGRKAAVRAAERALIQLRPGKHLHVALLPSGQDPDDLVRAGGAAAFESVAAAAQPLADFLYGAELAKIDRNRPDQRASLRARLEELARTCEDRFEAEEYARTFRSRFFEDFGWKQGQRQALRDRVVATSERHRPDLSRLFVRSTLFGLSRFPKVVARNFEAVGAIEIRQPELARWRDLLISTVIQQPHLDDDGIKAILETEVQPELRMFDLTADLRFGFNLQKTAPASAVLQLEAMIEMLSQEAELTTELDALDRAAVADAGGDSYEAIEQQRRKIRAARSALQQRGADWDVDGPKF